MDDRRMDVIGQNGNTGDHYLGSGIDTSGVTGLSVEPDRTLKVDNFTKYDDGKTDYSLIPPEVIEALADQLTYGAKKYSADNWKTGSATRYYSALMRHLFEWRKGNNTDEEGRSHLQAVLCNASFLYYLEEGKV